MLIKGKMFEKIASGKYYQELLNKNHNKNKIINEISENLAIGILNVSYILDPEIIILGGGFSELKGLVKKVKEKFNNKNIIKRNIPVIHAKLGDNAGLIGASLLYKK